MAEIKFKSFGQFFQTKLLGPHFIKQKLWGHIFPAKKN